MQSDALHILLCNRIIFKTKLKQSVRKKCTRNLLRAVCLMIDILHQCGFHLPFAFFHFFTFFTLPSLSLESEKSDTRESDGKVMTK